MKTKDVRLPNAMSRGLALSVRNEMCEVFSKTSWLAGSCIIMPNVSFRGKEFHRDPNWKLNLGPC